MGKSIAKISGIALRPGVSRNNREYTRDAIASAVQRAQARIAEGAKPLTMLSHHEAGDDSTRIVGSIRSITLDPDGSARYEADIADTDHGRTIATLLDPGNGNPHLRGVSIRGAWAAPVQRKVVDGQTVEYADDLELAGLDFTANPGVDGAGVDSFTRSASGKPRETADGRVLIFESVVEATIITEDTTPIGDKPAETVTFADPGYLADGKPRLPVDTREGLRHAWETVRETSLDTTYTDRQKRRIRERVGKAATKLGYDVTPGGWLISAPVTESEVWPDRPGSYCVSVDNGMVSISVSSYQVDPADLEVCARAAMEGACAALAAIDPDMDGDVDTEARPDDNAMESGLMTHEAARESMGYPATDPDLVAFLPLTSPPADTPSAATATQKETGMAESTTPAAGVPAESATVQAPVETAPETVAEPMLSLGQVKDLFASFAAAMTPQPLAAPAESAPAAPVAEAAPVVQVQESAEEKIARLVAEGIKAALPAAVQEHVEANGVQRKGLVVEAAAPAQPEAGDEYPAAWPRENGIPKAAHLLTGEEWKGVRSVLSGAVIAGARGRR